MLLMLAKGIRGGMCHAVHRYAKANIKYMKDYDPSKESSSIIYLDVNKLYGWTMSQKLPVDGFKWENNKFDFYEDFIQNNDGNRNKGYTLEANVDYPKELSRGTQRPTILTRKNEN